MSGLAVETVALGKRYGRVWALQDCSIEVPAGRVSGLVGANGQDDAPAAPHRPGPALHRERDRQRPGSRR